MDMSMLLREYATKPPVVLTPTETLRVKEILEISHAFTKKDKISELYVEFRNLKVKEKGSVAMLVLFDIVSEFLGNKHDVIFEKLTVHIPRETEGDQYGTWSRRILNETSTKELYAYLMGAYLNTHDQLPVDKSIHELATDSDRELLVYRAYHCVLPAKDIMAAKASDDSREIDKMQLRKLVDEFLFIVSENIL